MDVRLEKRIWWEYLDHDLRELLKESSLLIEKVQEWDQKFHDYSFVVFPAAKAYEGFLKKLFLDLGFIEVRDFRGKRFRVGKALNPSLDPKRYKKRSVYRKLVSYCQGPELADNLWRTWKNSRNVLFHWFPDEKNAIDFPESTKRFELILNSMDKAFKECKIDRVEE